MKIEVSSHTRAAIQDDWPGDTKSIRSALVAMQMATIEGGIAPEKLRSAANLLSAA